jgi:hypothetical protein
VKVRREWRLFAEQREVTDGDRVAAWVAVVADRCRTADAHAMGPSAVVLRRITSLVALSGLAAAQVPCAPIVAPGPGVATAPVGTTYALTTFDPDGSGPLPAKPVVGGSFGVAAWDATTDQWSTLGAALPYEVRVLAAMPNGDVIAGLRNVSASVPVGDVRRFDGANWTPLVTSMQGVVNALHALPNGDLLIGGDFTSVNGVPANGLARWDGATWTEFAGGVAGPFGFSVTKFGVLANGDLVVGGRFSAAGGVAANNIAKWNGTSFSPLGSGLANPGTVVSAPAVTGLETLPNGDLFVCGMFQVAGGVAVNSVALWNGSSWSPMGAGLGGPSIYSGVLFSATQLPNGDVLVAGGYPVGGGGIWAGRLHRWDGSSWQQQGGALGSFLYAVDWVGGGVVAGGDGMWRMSTPCLPSATTLGAACAGSGGTNTLVANGLPWTGSTFSMTATGLAPLSLIAVDAGFAPLGPLSLTSIGLPNARPGCLLHIAPIYYQPGVSTTGAHTVAWAIPDSPTFAGLDVYWQFIVLEIDASLAILETTSTNALELTIGSF